MVINFQTLYNYLVLKIDKKKCNTILNFTKIVRTQLVHRRASPT